LTCACTAVCECTAAGHCTCAWLQMQRLHCQRFPLTARTCRDCSAPALHVPIVNCWHLLPETLFMTSHWCIRLLLAQQVFAIFLVYAGTMIVPANIAGGQRYSWHVQTSINSFNQLSMSNIQHYDSKVRARVAFIFSAFKSPRDESHRSQLRSHSVMPFCLHLLLTCTADVGSRHWAVPADGPHVLLPVPGVQVLQADATRIPAAPLAAPAHHRGRGGCTLIIHLLLHAACVH
jgi:hypothetical protein